MTRVLIVDNNPRDHERYRSFLGSEFELQICADGVEILRNMSPSEGRPDLAVILWELPGEPNGSGLLTYLHGSFPDLPVLVVSGLLDLARAARARALGAVDFLLKPLDRDRLQAAVRSAVETRASSPLLASLQSRIVGTSRSLIAALNDLTQVIPVPGEMILLVGENGTGKELLARATHELGPHRAGPWVAVNIAGVPPSLLESTLFGHEAGAFTDARQRRAGFFEESRGGTLFLDEIGELDLPLQSKLLRVLQERTFRRIGGTEDLTFTGRVVFATNRRLIDDVRAGRFREDLYHRIAGHEIRIPPLREREDDLWLLVESILKSLASSRRIRLARETKAILAQYPFPGNVRELSNILRSSLLSCTGGEILLYHLPVNLMQEREVPRGPAAETTELKWPARLLELHQKDALDEIENDFDRSYLPRRLDQARGNVTQAARSAGLDPKTFRRKWAQAGLPPLSSQE
jgi:DNA-binding NtrC family response regulator